MRAAVILLYTCLSSGVCISSVQSNMLNGIVGQTVTFPAAVKEIDYIFKDGSRIAKVVNRILQLTNGSYGTRLQWNSSPGLFSLSDLRRGDSGGYRVQHKDGKTNDYQLVVWDPVPKLQVFSRNKMKPNCSVLCSVKNGRGVTLSWHREGQTLSHTSSPNFSSTLSLPLEIETNSAPYSCVATNPVSNKTVTVRPEELCFESVSKPHITSVAEGGRSCSLQCSVQNGREVTLSWRTEGQILSHTSSSSLSTLSLTLEIEASNFTYTCVATNPVSEERTAFHPTQIMGNFSLGSAASEIVSESGPGNISFAFFKKKTQKGLTASCTPRPTFPWELTEGTAERRGTRWRRAQHQQSATDVGRWLTFSETAWNGRKPAAVAATGGALARGPAEDRGAEEAGQEEHREESAEGEPAMEEAGEQSVAAAVVAAGEEEKMEDVVWSLSQEEAEPVLGPSGRRQRGGDSAASASNSSEEEGFSAAKVPKRRKKKAQRKVEDTPSSLSSAGGLSGLPPSGTVLENRISALFEDISPLVSPGTAPFLSLEGGEVG